MLERKNGQAAVPWVIEEMQLADRSLSAGDIMTVVGSLVGAGRAEYAPNHDLRSVSRIVAIA